MTEIQEIQEQAQTSIIRKIQKLFNLAQNAEGNENQAAAALAKAQQMLAEHNLSLAVVQDTVVPGGVVGGQAVIEEKRDKTVIKRSAMYKWQRYLWKHLSHINYCFHWVHDVNDGEVKDTRWFADAGDTRTRWVKRHVVLGRESNVLVVQLMGEYICDTIERLCPYPQSERLSRSAISWREGVAHRLVERMYDNQQDMEGEKKDKAANSTALALRDVRDKETEANYDALLGQGAYQEKLNQQKRNAAIEEEQQRARIAMLQNETAAEKRVREKAEEKARIQAKVEAERKYKRIERERLDDARRTDWRAYDQGRQDGEDISLNPQVSNGRKTPALKG